MQQSDFVNRGQALVQSGQYQEAVKVCRLGLLGRPTTVEGRIVLGQALLALKRFDEVLAEMRVALELDHTSTVAQTLKSEALIKKGDFHGALEVLQGLRKLVPNDPHVGQLYADAQRMTGRPAMSASHPSVGFVGAADSMTRNYPGPDEDLASTSPHPKSKPSAGSAKPKNGAPLKAQQEVWDDDSEETGDAEHYTRPTSLSSPPAKKRSTNVSPVVPPPQLTPPPNVLAVGDRSGTVEVDPEIDGVEVDHANDEDFGALAAPPVSKRRAPDVAEPRGSVKRGVQLQNGNRAPQQQARKPLPRKNQNENSTVELDDIEMIDVEPVAPKNKGSTKVRSAVNIAAGPLPESPIPSLSPTPASTRKTAPSEAIGPGALQNILAAQPHIMQMQPLPGNPRGPIAAALPTQAAMPLPGSPVDALFGGQPAPAPAWAKSTVAAQPLPSSQGSMGPGINGMLPPGGMFIPQQQQQMDPAVAALLDGMDPAANISLPPVEPTNSSASRPMKTGIRKGRSKLSIVLWFFAGALVIGGGVFAGFWIRNMKLADRIDEVRGVAFYTARIDTWRAWLDARDDLGGITKASSTIENRARLARVRALIAYEFGDGAPEARVALDNLGTEGGIDAAVGSTYLALAQHEPKAAKSALDRVKKAAPDEATTAYLAAQVAVEDGDAKKAIPMFEDAIKKDAAEAKKEQAELKDKGNKRSEAPPIVHANYYLGLARAKEMIADWRGAIASIDEALVASPEHPGAIIERAMVLAMANATPTTVMESRKGIEGVIAEAGKKVSEQKRGVSPLQVAQANLALAEIDLNGGDMATAKTHLAIAANVGVDDQRFAEAACEAVLYLGDPALVEAATQQTLSRFPTSRRAQIVYAQLQVALGKAGEALDFLESKGTNAASTPRGRAVLGLAKLANDDLEGAEPELKAAADATTNRLDLAVAGLALVDLEHGKGELGLERIKRFVAATTTKEGPILDGNTVAIGLAQATILRQMPAAREDALKVLQGIEKAPGPDGTRIKIELARVYRDLGMFKEARAQLAAPVEAGNAEAKFELGLVLVEDRDPKAASTLFDAMIRDSGPKPPPPLIVEAARARMFVGDHEGAKQLLDQVAPGTAGAIEWKVERERARLYFRRGDTIEAGKRIALALEKCGTDYETFFLAADIVFVDLATDEAQATLQKRLVELTKARLGDSSPEAQIVGGKLALAFENLDEASKLYMLAQATFKKQKAPPRRAAQADFGLAVVNAKSNNPQQARDLLESVELNDPSIYDAFLFHADVMMTLKDPARAFALAKQAVALDGDLVQGWQIYGELAAATKNAKELALAITRVGDLAPNSPELAQLQALKK